MTDDACRDLDLSGGLGEQVGELVAAGFAALWHGEPLLLGEWTALAGALEARGRCEVVGDRLVGIHGLTARPTRHHFVHCASAHHTWCAFDSIGIPGALGIDAVAHTDCPTCGRAIALEIERGVPSDSADLVLWLPDATGDHLMETFCSAADLYCSTEHLAERIDRSVTKGDIVDLAGAVELGRETWADVADLELA